MSAPVDHSVTPDIRSTVDELLHRAVASRASDVHCDPGASGTVVRFRVDGLLEPIATFDVATGRAICTRLMVLAKLLTYRLDVPQEGSASIDSRELRISMMPTTHGPRVVVRLPVDAAQLQRLDQLSLPEQVLGDLRNFVGANAGLLIVTGPAGSGKTTTIYALLEEIIRRDAGMSVVSLEDPVERDLPGVTQIEVSPFGQLTYETALRSMLRQDPQVLMLGEIRDAATAAIAVQAALSGHRLICTLHAASPAGAIVRLLEMGIEPYQLTSALFAIMTQRLLRKRALPCLSVVGARLVEDSSKATQYSGRIPIAESIRVNEALRRAILDRADMDALAEAYQRQTNFTSMQIAANELIVRGLTDADEVVRVFGELTSETTR